ncbi:MAG: glycosyltransferase family 4 protein [Oscillospiraceae bacterium]|nr:glycosyltransferase family 4 protein [Oscillospiraceae bacterium]
MARILVTAAVARSIYKFRSELLDRLVNDGYQVTVCCDSDHVSPEYFDSMGCDYKRIKVGQQGKNPLDDIKLFFQYMRILRSEKPDVVLTYTVKPNIYASIASRWLKIPYINNVTGLGVIGNKGFLQKILFVMQKFALSKSSCVFFQNESNLSLYRSEKIVRNQFKLIPGSGVNIKKYHAADYPSENTLVKFITVARIRKDKGIDELFAAVRVLKEYSVEFHIVGPCEDKAYIGIMNKLQQDYPVIYHGQLTQEQVHEMIIQQHCLIHPSHSEGMANVILESAACARPVIATNIPGCREAVDDGETGYLYPVKDADALTERIKHFVERSWEEKQDMGFAGRRKIEIEFDRNIVVNAYLEEIKKVLEI